MPYQVRYLIENKGAPICVCKNEPVSRALSLMIEYDYSQLPVVRQEGNILRAEGMITYESIMRGLRHFNAKIGDICVRDVMVGATTCDLEEDLFDVLDSLSKVSALLVEDDAGALVGIVTSYDIAGYFRSRTEDLMLVEDIEILIKDFIKLAYTDPGGELNEAKLDGAILRIASASINGSPEPRKKREFSDLTLNEYNTLLLLKDTWPFFTPIFSVNRNFVQELLDGVREIRNVLAHFRSEITTEQRDRLRYCSEWLTRCQEEYQARDGKIVMQPDTESVGKGDTAGVTLEEPAVSGSVEPSTGVNLSPGKGQPDFQVTDAAYGGGRYAPLADWLQSQPGNIDQVEFSFEDIERIIGAELPPSARTHRVFWANDSVGHVQSQLWLEAGWRVSTVNLTAGKVTFNRIAEREKAYINFFGILLDELKKKADFPIRDSSPDGTSWVVIQTAPLKEKAHGSFVMAFSRLKRFRVEVYLDFGDQAANKAVFDILYAQKAVLEAQTGPMSWERLDDRRASRIAIYCSGHIAELKTHPDIRKWAVPTMIKFYNALAEPVSQAIRQVTSA